MLDGLYRRIREGIHTWKGKTLLGVAAFLECTIIPVTIELVATPLMVVSGRPYLIAHIISIGTLVGALASYALGAFMFEPVIQPLLEWAGWMDDFRRFEGDLLENGFWAVFLVGLTPIPFQIGTVGAGVLGYSLPMFILAVLISRGIRYYAIAILADILGHKAHDLIERYGSMILFVGTGVLVGGAVLYSLLA